MLSNFYVFKFAQDRINPYLFMLEGEIRSQNLNSNPDFTTLNIESCFSDRPRLQTQNSTTDIEDTELGDLSLCPAVTINPVPINLGNLGVLIKI